MKKFAVAFSVLCLGSVSFAAEFCGFEVAVGPPKGEQMVICDFDGLPSLKDLRKAERKLNKIAPGYLITKAQVSDEGATLTVSYDGKIAIPARLQTRDDGAPLGRRRLASK